MLAAVNFNASTGALTVVGNAIADTISLTNSADHQSFTVDINNNASLQQTFNYSDVTSVRVLAGDGDDLVYNTLLIETEIFGQNGNDRLEGGWANDRVIGGNGSDILVGKNGDDILNGQAGNDSLFGSPGEDDLLGWTGNDKLYGGTGNDDLVGHEGVDLLWGNDGDDFLKGNEGNDTLRGEVGNDILRGDGGDDWLVGGDGDDELYGDAGADELLGQNGNDILDGGTDNDLLYAGDGDDTLNGDAGSDHLYGQGGDDLLDAGSDQAADVLTGGKGLDQFVVAGSIGSGSVDSVTDRAGFETYDGFSGTLTALAELDGDVLTIRGMPGDDKIQIFRRNGQDDFEVKSEHQSLGTYSNAAISEIVINGGAGNDLIDNVTNSIVPMRVDGDAGEDVIYGGDGDDILSGGSGGDKIWGGDGEDTLLGEVGNDELFGEDDDDTLRGGEGDDKLYGGSDDDTLHGDAGRDELFGGSSNDILSGGTDDEIDILKGNSGLDQFYAVRGDNIVDKDSSESAVDPVSTQTQLIQDAAATAIDDSQFSNFIAQLPDDAIVETTGNFTKVVAGARTLAFHNDGGANYLLANFPSNFSTADIAAISSEILSLQADAEIQSLGSPTFSVVSVQELEGTSILIAHFKM